MAGAEMSTYDLLAQSLLDQTYLQHGGDLEVIVVDRTNPLPRRELTHFLGDRVRFFRPRETPWMRLGLFAAASARNTGLVHAGGMHDPCDVTVVALDDCYSMSPRFLERVAAHASEGRYVVPILPNSLDAEQRFGAPWRRDTGHHPGGIVAYPLDKAIEINGYDEKYDGASSYEDIDFTARLELAGVQWVRDEAVSATLHAPHGDRVGQPRCSLLIWMLAETRRAAGVPWTAAELAAFTSCGRELTPPRCWRNVQHDPRVGLYGGQCDYDDDLVIEPEKESESVRALRAAYRFEPEVVRTICTTYETRDWFDLAMARQQGVNSPEPQVKE
jgi:glycosyltransferase involved in cell wall biosynthesis